MVVVSDKRGEASLDAADNHLHHAFTVGASRDKGPFSTAFHSHR
jgi:hypothetical protein